MDTRLALKARADYTGFPDPPDLASKREWNRLAPPPWSRNCSSTVFGQPPSWGPSRPASAAHLLYDVSSCAVK